MRIVFSLVAVLTAAACSTPEHVGRAPLCPPLSDRPHAEGVRQERIRAEADKSPPLVTEPVRQTTRESPPTYRSIVEYVEVPVPAEPLEAPSTYVGVDEWSDDVRSQRRHREPWFPVNTAVGAGVGAIIGHQSGRRGRGALIGGSVGLLLDMTRWLR